MPLRDHFRPPFKRRASWEEIHGMWPARIVILLKERLPPGFVSAPMVHSGSYIEVDIATDEWDDAPAIYAASCRWLMLDDRAILQTWSHVLSVGQPLPTLPLWLTPTTVVPLDLERSYEKACEDLSVA